MKIFAVASGKGGTGKSCVAAYTAAALAKLGKKVLLVEMGADTRSLDLITGVSDTALFTSYDVAAGRCSPEKALLQTALHPNLYMIPASADPEAPPVGQAVFGELCQAYGQLFDCLLLDGVDYMKIAPKAIDCILMLTTPDSLCVRACAALTRDFYEAGARSIRLVINRVPPRILPMRGAEDFDDVIDIIAAQLIAVLPESPKLAYASNNAKGLDQDSLVPEIFDALAQRMVGKSRPLLIK